MPSDDLTVRLQTLDGRWETVGSDRLRGIEAEGLVASSNSWGSDTASFDLRRDAGAIYPDLGPFTPLEIEVAGEVVWSGRIKETPSREGADEVINVQAEGWQYALDDDVYDAYFVHSDLTQWKDARSYLTAPLGNAGGWYAAGTVTSGEGLVTASMPQGQPVGAFSKVGAILDLGPNRRAQRAVVTFDSSNSSAFSHIIARGTDDLTLVSGFVDFGVTLNSSGASGTIVGTIGAPGYRYVMIFMQDTGGGHTPNPEEWVRFKSAQIFAIPAYESGNASILKASDVVTDAVNRSLLSSDKSQISTTSFNIPTFAPAGARTHRESIDAVNAFHDYLAKVDVFKRLSFSPRPSRPKFEVGPWAGIEVTDQGNSGEGIYNRVVIEGEDAAGNPIRVQRINGTDVQFRGLLDTYAGAPGSSPFTSNAGIPSGPPLPGQRFYKKGITYALRMDAIAVIVGGGVPTTVSYKLGDPAMGNVVDLGTFDPGTFTGPSQFVLFTPTRDLTFLGVVLSWTGTWSTATIEFKTSSFGGGSSTLPSRRDFQRTKILPVEAAMTTATAQQIGDVWLAGHRTTPFRGAVEATGPGAIRRVLGGDKVHPAFLLRETGELVRLSNRIDPDTGGQGRDATIASVTYTHAERKVAIELDNERKRFEAYLSRLALVTGQVVKS